MYTEKTPGNSFLIVKDTGLHIFLGKTAMAFHWSEKKQWKAQENAAGRWNSELYSTLLSLVSMTVQKLMLPQNLGSFMRSAHTV